MRPEIDFAGRTIQGDRDDQEDFYSFEILGDERLLLVLADGAGGQASGELASRYAALGFLDCFAGASAPSPARLPKALEAGNRVLAEFIDRDPAKRSSMATTLLAVMVEGSCLHWISVGDSPLLLFRGGELIRLNQDHSGAGMEGTPLVAKNVLLSALMGGRIPLVDWRREPYPLQSGDVLIMASDGLWTLLPEEIVAHLNSGTLDNSAADLARGLIEKIIARKKPHQDNATVTIVKTSPAM